MNDWLMDLPKVELHCHLEGSMSVATVQALTERHGADPSGIWPDGLPAEFSFDGFPSFAAQFFYGLSLLRTGDDLATITDDLAAVLVAQNVRYVELTTTAYTHFLDRADRPGMSRTEYRDGLNEGRRRAAARGVQVGWVIDIPRDLEMPEQTVTIDYLESGLTPDGLVAIGLGGYEVGFPAEPYAEHFARAHALGLPAVPHAGETEGPDSVRQALALAGTVRIGHGVRSIEHPSLIAELIDRDVMLEVCPTSNLKLWVYDRAEDHPLPALIDAGVRVCLNTDDPGWFATDLVGELAFSSQHYGVTRAQHMHMQRDAVSASLADAAIKRRILAELDVYTDRSG